MEKWNLFKEYNARDVEVEQCIQARLSKRTLFEGLWEEYELDQEINDLGIAVDMEFVNQAIAFADNCRKDLVSEISNLTGVENPNSVVQLKDWFGKNGLAVESLAKKDVLELLDICPDEFKQVLKLRQQLAKNSIKKYTAMQNAVCSDNRAHGMFMFYGANRTGRFAGRIVQLQNLPQNHLPDLDTARVLVKAGLYDTMQLLYDDVPDTLSQLIRTAFVPKQGKKFIVADFSAIEARILAWLAGEQWRIKAFVEGKDIYCQSATQMFGLPVEKNGINGHLRQKGKIAELALGYGGGVVALKSMGALEMGLREEELEPLVRIWRETNPMITQFWWDMDRDVRETIKTRHYTRVRGIMISIRERYLFIGLPNGRNLVYVEPGITTNNFGNEAINYYGNNSQRKWMQLDIYGPKIVENIVQGIARDILLFAMKNLNACGYKIVAHVHDEVIIEADEADSVETICNIMAQSPEWAKGLLLKADGYECMSYRKC